MFSIFKRRAVLITLGLVLLALVILLYGDQLSALDSTASRLTVIAVPVGLVAIWELFKRIKTSQANSQLQAAVVDQAKADPRQSGDVVQLRERFEEAVAMLKQQKKRGGMGLYELPWYVIIGAPGSGKTTALKYSGLKFPLEQRSGRGALRGVGGTRNCDWWFTEEAVLLDTAGRYTTQDSDASADSAGWAEFLALLKKYRKRRPLNGVLLAISAHDLITQGHAGREAHVMAARRRLNELNKELKIQLPVYVLVTKCDLLAGFSEYFDDMSQEGRAQVLGVTFPQDVTFKGGAANAYPEEFDAVVERLNQRVLSRLEEENDGRRRAKIFGFPQQLASLRENLTEFVAEVFESTRFDQRVLLRGVYFTSGTQEGTPIDRLLGALSRRFAVAADAIASPGRGKSFFIERLMKEVVLAESGIAGVSRRLELQKAAAQFGLYVGMLGAGALLLVLLFYSYGTNSGFLDRVHAQALQVQESLGPPTSSVVAARPRLDRIRELVEAPVRYRDETWWIGRGWGLDQSDSVEEAAGTLYKNELRRALVDTVNGRIEQRLKSLVGSSNHLAIYRSLRAYLMLQNPQAEYFSRDEVRSEAKQAWAALHPNSEEDAGALDAHFHWLLESGLPSTEVNRGLVSQARAAIPAGAAPRLVLSLVEQRYKDQMADAPPAITSDVFRARNGRPIGEALPPVYSKRGFEAAQQTLIAEAARQYQNEPWVWEGSSPGNASEQQVWAEYEREYIRHWKRLLENLGYTTGGNMGDFMLRLANERQGLKPFLQAVDLHTFLVPPPKPPSSILGDVGAWITSQVDNLSGSGAKPGWQITRAFAEIHFLVVPVEGKSAIDEMMANMKAVGEQLKKNEGGGVGAGPSAAGAADLTRAVETLKQSATALPGAAGSISVFVNEVTRGAEATGGSQIAVQVRDAFSNFESRCSAIINGYPFRESAQDVMPDDLKKLLGPDGALAKLMSDLGPYAEERNGRWVPKELGGKPLEIGAVLVTMNQALAIKEAFFAGSEPKFRFEITVADTDDRMTLFELSEVLFPDGKPLRFDNAAGGTKAAEWPPRPGELNARFYEGSNPSQRIPGGSGPWSLFKLIEQGTLTKKDDTTFELRLARDPYYAILRLRPTSRVNPLVLYQSRALQNFRCGR